MTDTLHVAIPLFPRFTALDAVGPYEVLQRIPSIDVTFVGERTGEVRTENGMLGLSVDATFDELPEPDVIVFPGGVGTRHSSTTRGPRVGAPRPRHHPVHHLGVHRLPGPRRGRPAAGPHRHHPLVVLPRARGARRPSYRRSGWSNTSISGSSPRPGCRVASTWPCDWWSCWSTARRPKRPS